MFMSIEEIKSAVLPACREFEVRRLDVFGSVSRGAASPASDIDLLVEFNVPDRSPAKRFFGLLHRLEDTLGCDVDLLTSGSLRNPYFRKRVLSERVSLYEG
jgi:predicted nucleotidyltransferase